MEFRGIFPALTTPFEADGEVSLSGLKENIGRYNKTGLAGYVVLGSTGESVMLGREEADAVLVAVKETAAPGKLLIAGTGAESTSGNNRADEARGGTRLSSRAGENAVLLQTCVSRGKLPAALPRRGGCLADSRAAVFRAAFTGVTLETPEILALAEHAEHCGDKGQLRQRATSRRSRFRRASDISSAHGRRFGGVSGAVRWRERRDSGAGVGATGKIRGIVRPGDAGQA